MTAEVSRVSRSYGTHLALRLTRVQNRQALDDPELMGKFLVHLVARLQMRILDGPRVATEQGPDHRRGHSGVVILHESHAAIHTYPTLGEVFLDVFSCKSYEVAKVLSHCEEYMGTFSVAEQVVLDRGQHWVSSNEAHLATWVTTR